MTEAPGGSTDHAETSTDPGTATTETGTVLDRETPRGDSPAARSIDPAALVAEGPILLFDGVCNLCNGTIQWVIRQDPERQFRFAPLQSAAGQALLEYADVDVGPVESFVMVDGDDAFVKSGAALRVASRLGLPWSLARPFLYVPRVVRDGVYDIVATYRYRVFGKRDQCMVPDEDVRDRFVEMD